MSSPWLAWPKIGGYLESKKLWSVKPALPYLNPNSQMLGELTKPFRWFYMKGNLVGSRPSCCWGAHQVSLRAPRTRQSLTGFSVGSRGHESPRRVGVHFRSFLWCSSNTSPIMGILLSHNDHLSTRSIDFVILLNNKKERLNLFFINESQNSDDFLPFFSWPEDHFTHLNYNLFSRFHLLFPTSCVNAFMCLTVICLRGSAMNNAASGQKNNFLWSMPRELKFYKSKWTLEQQGSQPSDFLVELLLLLYVGMIDLANLIFSLYEIF